MTGETGSGGVLLPGGDQPELAAVRARLFERRVVLLSGWLDDGRATRAAAELMTLDASGDDPISLQVDCPGATIEAAFTLVDTIDLLGVPVHTTCAGTAGGPAACVVAVGDRRTATPHARFQLAVPSVSVEGDAASLERVVQHHQAQLEGLVRRLAAAAGQPVEHVEADVHSGRWLDGAEARRYGLVDEVRRPPGRLAERPRLPFGFIG